jgi:hypothetical protein
VVKKKKPIEISHYTIVGMQYRIPKETRRMLSTEAPFGVYFKREPNNEHDPNAIAAFVAKDNFMENVHLGYLRKEVAAVLVAARAIPAAGIVDSVNVDAGTAEVQLAISSGKLGG